jgi:hypothetical protein
MINSADVHDLQLEDVEDYSADYPPVGFPNSEENIAAMSPSGESNSSKNYGRSTFMVTIARNKWVVALCFVLLVVLITIIAVAGGGSNAPVSSANAGTGTHAAPISIDPKTLDPKITEPLMETLLSIYVRHGLDDAALGDDAGLTAQKKAFYWLATEENLNNMDHTQISQRYALAVFYYATNAIATPHSEDPLPWVSAHLWLSKAHACEWQGVVCNEQQHVQSLDLERNNLSGNLPMELAILAAQLESLNLTSNLIHMEGSMFDVFRSLIYIEIFLMDDNFLEYDKGLPAQFKHMNRMKKMRLSYNLFAGELEKDHQVLSELGQLTHLEVESNFLTGTMPAVVGDMENLVYLYMRRNEMSYNLDFLKGGKLTSLFALWLDNNQMTGTIPTEIGLLTDLASVSMTNATLVGSIPTEFGELTDLRRLWLYSNELTGQIPSELNELAELEVLEVHKNKLDGAMPQGICTAIGNSGYEYKSLTSDCKSAVQCDDSCCTECY